MPYPLEREREKYFRPMSNFYSGPLQCSLFAHTSTPVRSYSHPVVGWKVSHSRIYYHFFFLLFCLLAFFFFFSLLPDRLPPSASVPGSKISPIIFVQINRSGKHVGSDWALAQTMCSHVWFAMFILLRRSEITGERDAG